MRNGHTYGDIADPATLGKGGMDPATPVITREQAWTVFNARQPAFQVTVTQTLANATWSAIYGRAIFNIQPCGGGGVHGVGGAQDRIPGHTPAYFANTGCMGIGCGCENTGIPPAVWIGFDHGNPTNKTRSIWPRIPTSDNDANTTEHCAGVVWEAGGKLDLFSLLHPGYLEFKDDLYFTSSKLSVNSDGELEFGKDPKDMEPDICLVKLRYRPRNDEVFDKIWIVVNSTVTWAIFNQWLAENPDINWTAGLPAPFPSIPLTISTSWFGTVSTNVNVSAMNLTGTLWHPPENKNSFMHHDARFEMRSHPITGGHGHQAMYDGQGNLITAPIAAGTADLWAPYSSWNIPYPDTDHLKQDVQPFIRALQLDGNPVLPTNVNRNFNRPCIYMGGYTGNYIEKRPVLPTGVRP
ncbi:MAG: hypothetical protein FWH21_04975 [Kiritimatiellaeota bacterium]|nr:hypothetical protein [Kiritimatiellota bacterium]